MVNVRKKNPAGTVLTVMLLAALLTICLELGLSYLRPDTPGSIPKHLIHFAVMFTLLGGAVLLCLFCPPFKKLWAWIDEHILSKETRPIAIDIIYAVIAGLMLLHHFYVLLHYPVIPTGATRLAPFWIVFAAITVLLGKSWQNGSFWLAAVFFIFSFERLYIEKLIVTGETAVYFSSAIYSFFICLSAFSILRPSVWKPFLQILCSLWAVAILALSIVGLYVSWTGGQIANLVGTTNYMFKGRLSLFAIPTITSSILGSGIIMMLVGFSVSTHKPIRLFYLLSCFVALVTNSLTDSRSSFLMIALMLTGVMSLGLWTIYRNQKGNNFSGKKTMLVVILLVVFFCGCFYGTIEGQRYLGPQFVEIRNNGYIIPSAKAEESITEKTTESTATPEPPKFSQRNVWISDSTDINYILSDRFSAWQKGFKYIRDNPDTLLYGLSIDGSVAPIVGREDHSHNILLQILLEGGIPTLLLYLSLMFYGVYHAFRLWNRRGIPFWQRVLPLPVFSILLLEMAECLTHFSFGLPPMTLFWFFLGATITVSKSLGKAPKTTEQPAIPAESAVTETGE